MITLCIALDIIILWGICSFIKEWVSDIFRDKGNGGKKGDRR